MSTATPQEAPKQSSRRAESDLRKRFETLARRVFATFSGQAHTLGITSCGAREGVSTVAANLAAASVDVYDGRVLLIDGNLQRPSLAKNLGLGETPGLAEALRGEASGRECIAATKIDGLFAMPAGVCKPRGDSLCGPAGAKLITELRSDYRLIVVDLPPHGGLDDRLLASELLDGYLLVVEAEHVRRQVAARVQQDMQRAGGRLLGVVLNKRAFHIPSWLYKKL